MNEVSDMNFAQEKLRLTPEELADIARSISEA
jgi:hypothetical protein